MSLTLFYIFLKNCVGAIDGTHVPCTPPKRRRGAYRNRHGTLSHNVLVVVDFSGYILYILSGWEGSAHDSRVLRDALENRGLERPPHGTLRMTYVQWINIFDMSMTY